MPPKKMMTSAERQQYLAQMVPMDGQELVMASFAHDINNPLAVLSSTVIFLQHDLAALDQVLGLYRQADPQIAQDDPGLHDKIQAMCRTHSLALDQQHALFSRMSVAIERIRAISKELDDFANRDRGEPAAPPQQ